MKPLDRQSERYSPTGNLASRGVLNTLGKPHMDMLAVLVREAVQNSWDAKLTSSPQVLFGISLRTLTESQRGHMLNTLFESTPASPSLHRRLLTNGPLRVLELHDRGTSGLGGPTRADLPDNASEPRDFVDFLRNVGHPPDKLLGGGTFGYGKAALYLVSNLRTICVHTHAHYQRQPVSRLMACAIGDGYTISEPASEQGIYTGRHWWGRRVDDNIVDPLLADNADRLALDIGLPEFTNSSDRGTTIMIVDPLLGGRTPEQALNVMQLTLLWFFWPKMITFDGLPPPMRFELSLEGQTITIPPPETTPPFSSFVRAMQLLKTDTDAVGNNLLGSLYDIDVLSPRRHLGRLALLRNMATDPLDLDTGAGNDTENSTGANLNSDIIPFTGRAHHVALMRQAELVVKYVPCDPLPTDVIEDAGVFLADRDMDRVYARSEPPTHDDWVCESISDRHEKTCIRVTYRRIQEKSREFVNPTPLEGESGKTVPLGSFAGTLGSLLVGQDPHNNARRISRTDSKVSTAGGTAVTGAGTKSGRRRPGNGKSHARISLVDDGDLLEAGASVIWKVRFTVTPGTGSSATLVEVIPGILLDGGQIETDPPAGTPPPRLLNWRDPDGGLHAATGRREIEVPAESTGVWELSVEMPADFHLALDLRAKEAS